MTSGRHSTEHHVANFLNYSSIKCYRDLNLTKLLQTLKGATSLAQHSVVWNVLHAARCKYRTHKVAKNRHLGTIAQLCRAISSQLRHISTIWKKLLSSNMSSRRPHNMVNFGSLAAEIGLPVRGTPANFNGFRVLAALLHGSQVVSVSQILRRWTEGATYVRQGDHHVGHWPPF